MIDGGFFLSGTNVNRNIFIWGRDVTGKTIWANAFYVSQEYLSVLFHSKSSYEC